LPQYKCEDIEFEPMFDLELYMALSQIQRIDENVVGHLKELYGKYEDQVRVKGIKGEDGKGFLIVWIEKGLESDVERMWGESESRAYELENVAHCLAMSTAADLIPELYQARCAPLPEPTPELIEAVGRAGFKLSDKGALDRKFSVLTFYPYEGGCEVCWLRQDCPKLKTQSCSGVTSFEF